MLLLIKKMLKILFPKLPIEIIDLFLQPIFNDDISPQESIMRYLKMHPKILSISYGMITNNADSIQDDLYEISDKIMPKGGYSTLFRALYSLHKFDSNSEFEDLAKVLGIDDKYKKLIPSFI